MGRLMSPHRRCDFCAEARQLTFSGQMLQDSSWLKDVLPLGESTEIILGLAQQHHQMMYYYVVLPAAGAAAAGAPVPPPAVPRPPSDPATVAAERAAAAAASPAELQALLQRRMLASLAQR